MLKINYLPSDYCPNCESRANKDGEWCLISDHAIATFLGANIEDRKKLLLLPLQEATQVNLEPAVCVYEKTSLEDALHKLKAAPLLVCSETDPKRLLGIVTAFDLL